MKKTVLALAVVLLSFVALRAQPTSTLRERLEYHVGLLASDSLGGRKAGSANSVKAGDYIIAEMKAMGLHGYTQSFTIEGKEYRNIIGRIEGRCDTMIIIGAHYDHLGIIGGEIYHGADDNASGTAAMLELARNLVSSGITPKYTILLVAFDGEELGLYGSRYMASQLPADKVALMVSMDMVGWYKASGKLTLEGTGTLKNAHRLFADAAVANGITIHEKRFETSLFTATDTQWFAGAGIPTLAVTTGTKSPYHQPEDTSDKIDYEGLEKVVGFMTRLTTDMASDNLVASGEVSFKHGGSQRLSAGVTLGIGSNFQHYTEGALEGKTAPAYNAGIFVQYNAWEYVAFRAAAVYEDRWAEMPKASDMFGSSQKFRIQSVTLPLDLMLTTSNDQPVYCLASFGGYGSYVLGAKLDEERLKLRNENINRMEYGIQWGLGANIYNVYMTAHVRYALTNVFGDVKVRNHCSYFTIGYRF